MRINDRRPRKVLAQPAAGLSLSLDKGQIFGQRTKVDDTETGFFFSGDVYKIWHAWYALSENKVEN